jgi:hypothetical protein
VSQGSTCKTRATSRTETNEELGVKLKKLKV